MKYLLLLLAFSANAQEISLAHRPADWPNLEIKAQLVTHEQLLELCPGLPFYSFDCAIPLFKVGQCLLLLIENSVMARNHGTLHCNGYDHIGETTMRDKWLAFKSARQFARAE